MKARIDINADLGESPESLANGTDAAIMEYITSANIACGGHAGDVATMKQTLLLAKERKVSVGAHPGYPDRANFGRTEMPLTPAEVETVVREQIGALVQVAEDLGMRVAHVKPHGALYHAANRNREITLALGRAVRGIDPRLIMVGQVGYLSLELWREMGLRCVAEAFADRVYEPDGTLRKRTLPGALLDMPAHAAEQAINIALRHTVAASDGSELPIVADTICIHSDTPGARSIVREINLRLKEAGVEVRSFG